MKKYKSLANVDIINIYLLATLLVPALANYTEEYGLKDTNCTCIVLCPKEQLRGTIPNSYHDLQEIIMKSTCRKSKYYTNINKQFFK